jgi:hyperosmotically inducible protein
MNAGKIKAASQAHTCFGSLDYQPDRLILSTVTFRFDPEVTGWCSAAFRFWIVVNNDNRRKKKMKVMHSVKLVGCALVVLASFSSISAYAQASDAMAAPSAAAPSSKQANRALQKSVRRALAKAKGLDVSNILVRARGGAVTLEGTVPELQQGDIATQTAQGVAGVTSVKNALTVRAIGQ